MILAALCVLKIDYLNGHNCQVRLNIGKYTVLLETRLLQR